MLKQLHVTKGLLFLLCSLFIVSSSYAQSVNYQWAKRIGGTQGELINASVVDAAGNMYSTGAFRGTVDFDPGAGVLNLTAIGTFDIFVTKIDASGNFVWAKNMGRTGGVYETGYAIALDASGNVYVAGGYSGTVDFDPGSGVFNLTTAGGGQEDVFVLKLDNMGNFVWAKSVGGADGPDKASAITIDGSGNIIVGGTFNGTVDFDPGAGVANLAATGAGTQAFILKLDAAGNYVWAQTSGDFVSSVVVDGTGNIYAIGSFTGTVDFDAGTPVYNLTSNGSFDIFILKLSAAGSFSWAKGIGATGEDQGKCIRLDAGNNLIVTGYFNGTVDFDPGAGTSNLAALGGTDAFLLKLDNAGNFTWVKQLGGTLEDGGESIAIGTGNNIFITGYFRGTADFDPGANAYNMQATGNPAAAGSRNMFLVKLNASGNFIWARSNKVNMGSGFTAGGLKSEGRFVGLDATGNIYINGIFRGTCDFDPGISTFTLTSTGTSDDMYFQKLSDNGCGAPATPYTTVTATNCDSLSFGGQKFFATGVFHIPFTGSNSCDSIVALNATVNKATTNTQTQIVCDSIRFNGQNLTASGTYRDTLMNAVGCDSFLTLTLTVIQSSLTQFTEVACDSFSFRGKTYFSSGIYRDTLMNFAGCDSILMLNLTVNNSMVTSLIQSACDSFKFDGIMHFASGTYFDTLSTLLGCDSIVALNLTITSVDVSTVKSAATITANAQNATYQWVDCDNAYTAIAGGMNQSFTATRNGSYAVIVTQNSCTDTSDCKLVTHLTNDVSIVANESRLRIYPNPGNGLFILSAKQTLQHATVKIINITGQVVLERKELNGNTFNFDIESYADGIYIMEITEAGKSMQVKLIKQ